MTTGNIVFNTGNIVKSTGKLDIIEDGLRINH